MTSLERHDPRRRRRLLPASCPRRQPRFQSLPPVPGPAVAVPGLLTRLKVWLFGSGKADEPTRPVESPRRAEQGQRGRGDGRSQGRHRGPGGDRSGPRRGNRPPRREFDPNQPRPPRQTAGSADGHNGDGRQATPAGSDEHGPTSNRGGTAVAAREAARPGWPERWPERRSEEWPEQRPRRWPK